MGSRSVAKSAPNHNAKANAGEEAPARKKSSQKSTRPRGAKDAVTFPGAIGRNNACVRADSLQIALGGRKRLLRVGECIVADGRPPCQLQPLRGQVYPSKGPTLPRGSLVSGPQLFSKTRFAKSTAISLLSQTYDDLPLCNF